MNTGIQRLKKRHAASTNIAQDILDSFPGTKLYQTSSVSIANNSWTAVTFNAEVWDDAGWHSTSSNTERITFNFTGRVAVVAAYGPNTAANATFGLRIRKNGTTISRNLTATSSTGGELHQLNLATEIEVVPGDFIEMQAFQTSGGSLTTVTGEAGTTLSARKIK